MDHIQWHRVADFSLSLDLGAVINYLRQQGIPIRVVEEQGRQVLWVGAPEQAPLVENVLSRWQSGDLELDDSKFSSSNRFLNKATRTIAFVSRYFPITCLLITCSFIGAAAVKFPGLSSVYYGFLFVDVGQLANFETISESVLRPDFWRLMTPIFIHGSWFHFIFNAVILWVFGGRIEHVIGHWHFLALVLLSAVTSNLAQYWWSHSPYFGGMSGVNYGIIGYMWLRQFFVPQPLLRMPMGIFIFFFVWLLLGVFGIIDLFIRASIANTAHITGLLVGVTWGLLHGLYLTKNTGE